ncbi:MAG TPA: hypothetical protein ENK96_11005 [Desulfobulbaceae bacterium]|nr:hypothetical protein [Desulfobulbaceae bacterium]
MTQFRAELINEFDRLDKPAEFSVDVQYKLALVKKPGKADIVLTSGEGGEATRIIEVPKDPSRSHPLRRKEVVEEVNDCLKDWGTINGYDIQCINTVYNIRKRPEFFYKGKVKGSPPQYSSAFVDWIIAQHKKNKSFFFQARIKSKQKMIHKNKKEPSVQQRDGLQRA